MQENGSPAPRFDFDRSRTYFRVTLPAHPEYVALSALREYAYREALGDVSGALHGLEKAHERLPDSAAIAATLVRAHGERGALATARRVAEEFESRGSPGVARVWMAYAEACLARGRLEHARQIVDTKDLAEGSSLVELAILEKRLGRLQKAHRHFERAGERIRHDVRALHEFAQIKMKLAGQRAARQRPASRKRILREARELLERVLQMDAPPARHAWAWFDLGRVLRWLGEPRSDVVAAFEKAVDLAPEEARFRDALQDARKRL